MQIPFSEANSEAVEMAKSVDLKKIFGMIRFKKTESEIQKSIALAIDLIEIYCDNYSKHEGNFL